MSDRFKFRCWNTIVKGFVPIIMNGDGYFSIDQNAFEWEYGDDWDYVWEKENNTLEQCTGLKDKNGKLIYEGDIVQDVEDPLYVSVVMWDEIDLRWKTKGRGYEIVGSVYPENHIVIGNIHENPELLKESK